MELPGVHGADWSHHHLIFSNPGTEEDALREGRHAHMGRQLGPSVSRIPNANCMRCIMLPVSECRASSASRPLSGCTLGGLAARDSGRT